MAKKKVMRRKKKVRKVKAKRKKIVRKKKIAKARPAAKEKKEKTLGIVDHFFGHISVAAIKVKSPFKVGDVIHVKGHTTDFTQGIDSMQIEHQNVMRAKKGDDIGIKVKEKVRQHDVVYLAANKPAPPPKPKEPEGSGSYAGTKFLKF